MIVNQLLLVFQQIKFSGFIAMMFVVLSIVEAFPEGTCSLVLLKYLLVIMFYVLLITLFSDNFVPLSLAVFSFPRIKWLVLKHHNS